MWPSGHCKNSEFYSMRNKYSLQEFGRNKLYDLHLNKLTLVAMLNRLC